MPDRRDLDRRQFVEAMGTIGALAFLAGCGGIEGENERAEERRRAQPEKVDHPKTDFDQLTFSNWQLYIDKKVLRDFEKEYGAKVRYIEEIDSNEGFFGKFRQPLAAGQDIKRDLCVLTDPFAARMVRLGYVQKVDKDNIPNAKNLQPGLRSPQWDPERDYSLPWQSGMTVIGVNRSKITREIRSINDLFDPEFKGRVGIFNDARDAVNFVLLRDGKKPEDATIDDILAAIEFLGEQKRKGQIRRFTGNNYAQDFAQGNLWICQAYSGDVVQLQADNPDLDYVFPDEGATIWTDNMLVPVTSKNQYAAETMMNYVYDPEVAATIAAYVNYVTPVVGAKEVLAERQPELTENQLIFPDEETLATLHPYVTVTEEEDRRMTEAMAAVEGL